MSEVEHETRRLAFGAQAEASTEADVQDEAFTAEAEETPVETVESPTEVTESTETGGEDSTQTDESELVQAVEATQETNQTEVEGAVLADAPTVADETGQVEEREIPEIAPEAVEGEESIDALHARQADLNRQIEDRQNSEKKAVLEQIKTVAASFNITTHDIVEFLGGYKAKRNGKKPLPKYRNPADGKEWTGRGREPLWIKGQNRSNFLIKG